MLSRFWKSLITTGIHARLSLLEEQRIRLLNAINFFTIFLQLFLLVLGLLLGDYKLVSIMCATVCCLNLPLYGLIRSLRHQFAFGYAYCVAHAILLVVPLTNELYFHDADDSEIALIGLAVLGIVLFDKYIQLLAVVFNLAFFFIIRFFIKAPARDFAFHDYYSLIINVLVCYSFIYVCVSFAKFIFRQYQALLVEKNEQLLKQSIELQEVDKLKNQLFAVISHDLRSPLYNLQTTIKLLNEGHLSEAESKILVREIQGKTKEVNQLLSNLLNWSHLQLRGYKNNPVEIPLREIVEETAQGVVEETMRKQIAFHINMSATVMVWADENQLQLILRNLIGNAIKFTPFSGEVVVAATEQAKEIMISIQDTGVGITSEQLEAIISGKNKVSTLGTQGEKGNGLGLWLCREFIHRNGGEFWAISEEKQGSTFYFTLPKGEPIKATNPHF